MDYNTISYIFIQSENMAQPLPVRIFTSSSKFHARPQPLRNRPFLRVGRMMFTVPNDVSMSNQMFHRILVRTLLALILSPVFIIRKRFVLVHFIRLFMAVTKVFIRCMRLSLPSIDTISMLLGVAFLHLPTPLQAGFLVPNSFFLDTSLKSKDIAALIVARCLTLCRNQKQSPVILINLATAISKNMSPEMDKLLMMRERLSVLLTGVMPELLKIPELVVRNGLLSLVKYGI